MKKIFNSIDENVFAFLITIVIYVGNIIIFKHPFIGILLIIMGLFPIFWLSDYCKKLQHSVYALEVEKEYLENELNNYKNKENSYGYE